MVVLAALVRLSIWVAEVIEVNTLRVVFSVTILLWCVCLVTITLADHHESKAKHSIKEVMTYAHKSGLLKKVITGGASTEEKLTLLDHYLSLVENKPPTGDEASWQNLTGKATRAAAKVVVGREGALKELMKATNCVACHTLHKK